MTLTEKALDFICKNNGATLMELSQHLYGEVNDYTLERTRNLIAVGRKKGRCKLKNVYRLDARYILIENKKIEEGTYVQNSY